MSKIRSLDEKFLNQMHSIWTTVCALAGTLGISSLVYQLYIGNYNLRLLAILGVWIACVVLPIAMEISALISDKVRRRFLSWFMLISGVVVMMIDAVADVFVASGVDPAVTGIPSGLIIWFILRPSAGRLSRYFQNHLKSKTYQAEVEAFDATGSVKRDVLAIIIFYILVGVIVGIFFVS